MKPVSPESPRKMTLAEVEAMSRRDKRRIIVLAIGALLLAGAYFGTQRASGHYRQIETLTLPAQEEQDLLGTGEIAILEFDQRELLEAISDSTAEDRLNVNDQALTALLYYAMLVTPVHYRALGILALDPAVANNLEAEPSAHRMDPLKLRGELMRLSKRARAGTVFEEYYGTLALDSGGHAHVVFTSPPERPFETGDPVLMSGLFVQMYRSELDGEWIDAPLIASRELHRSTPIIHRQDTGNLRASLIQDVSDDQLDDVTGVPELPLWRLMAYARDQVDEVDWDAAAELNSESLNYLMQDGEAFRGVPYRIPISGNLGAWTERVGENGLRLDRVTKGWIGNFTWTGATGVIKWVAPFERPELKERQGAARLVTARGFFLKSIFYEQRDGNPGRAPLFVMADVLPFSPITDSTPQYILYLVLLMTVGLVFLIYSLLRSDRRSSERLRQDLARRRRARRGTAETPAESRAPEPQ